MEAARQNAAQFVRQHHPFDSLSDDAAQSVLASVDVEAYSNGSMIYGFGQDVDGLRMVARGEVELLSADGDLVAEVHVGDSFGQRALFNGGIANQAARARALDEGGDVVVYRLPTETFDLLIETQSAFRAFFKRFVPAPETDKSGADSSLVGVQLSALMTSDPVTVAPTTSVRDAAKVMADKHISCVLVVEGGQLVGLLTTGDITSRIVAAGADVDAPVSTVMTADPLWFSPDDSGFDAMLAMSAQGIGHLPIAEDGKPVGIITRTNLVRRQQVSAVYMIGDIRRLSDTQELAHVVDQVPGLLAQLVGSGVQAHKVGHVITSITDALTVRLLGLAKEKFGPPPVPYLWLACGSQGRREQTGVSDQDNCLILDNAFDREAHDPYFKALAQFVSDGLNEAGYFYCPGDMMATNDQWRQPVSVWRGYFEKWVRKPDPMAQMLASVMFDLRAISGELALFEGLQARTLELAKANSIFRAHMAANSLKHTPPLGLFRGFALIRSGEHKDTVDLKHNGVVPIVDLARMYALEGALDAVNTRERLEAARDAGTLSTAGASDLIDAFDLISTMRLRHQARQIRDGERPDNFLAPSRLSAFERNHLKDAFGVIKTMQSALGNGRSAG
ncbi:MAG: cyclic nucleotide-binding/CBS domain-containing protein [Devosiaceae bacterium]|nr:cyclic nucleotide-binding/CBS domain-containing protein [Devosiaceae bacterium MH13]